MNCIAHKNKSQINMRVYRTKARTTWTTTKTKVQVRC